MEVQNTQTLDELREERRLARTRRTDSVMKYVFLVCAVFSIVAVVGIVLYLLVASMPALREIGVFNFIFGSRWFPDGGEYGLLPMIVGTLYTTAGATFFGGILGIFGAVYLAKFCPKPVKGFFSQLVNLLAGIPSILFGLFGMIVLIPLFEPIAGGGNGMGLLAAWIILSIMILPTVLSISKSNIEAVDESVYEGAVALGCTHSQAVFKVVLPAAKSGVVTSVILGIGRAIGETMAIIMVTGGIPKIPDGLFSYFRTLSVNVILEMGYAVPGTLKHTALIATGFVLLVFVLLINVFFNLYKSKGKRKKAEKDAVLIKESRVGQNPPPVFRARPVYCRILEIAANVMFYLAIAFLALIIGFILIRGIPHLSFSFLFGEAGFGKISLLPSFVSTFWLILLTLVIAVPIGVFAAVFLVEYTKKKSKLVSVIRTFTETLAGIPSVVFGLFGMILFVPIFGLSLLSGAFTLVLMVLPTIVRSTEEALLSVPNALREGSLAMGASKVRTIFRVVLPCAISGIMTSIILAVGRIVGESAALIYTSGAVTSMPGSPADPGASFAVRLYMFMSEGLNIDQAYATGAVLLFLVLLLNLASYFTEKKLRKKY